jgi:hypothetical protein
MPPDTSEPPGPAGTNSYPPADARRRALARLLDLACSLAPLALVPEGHPVAGALGSGALLLFSDSLFGPGRSLGKRLFGLRTIILATRRPADPLASAQRNAIFALAVLPALFTPAPFLPVAEVLGAVFAVEAMIALLPMRRDLGQLRFGDLLAGTQVIDASIPLPLLEPLVRRANGRVALGPSSHRTLTRLRRAPRDEPPAPSRPSPPKDIACASP